MVIHKSETYIKLQLSVFMIAAGSYCGFLSNAGHVRTACCGHHGTYKHLREAFLGTECFRDYRFNKGIACFVSLLACRRTREEK